MSKKIKVDKITGEILIQDGEYSFKQYGIAPDIIQVIVDLQRDKENLESQLDFIEKQNKYISKLENNYKKAIHILDRFTETPCELMEKNIDNEYCEKYCKNGYKKCWEHFIEKCYSLEPFELEGGDSIE